MSSGWHPRQSARRPLVLPAQPILTPRSPLEGTLEQASVSSSNTRGDDGAESLVAAYKLPDAVWFEILEHAFSHQFPQCHSEHYSLVDTPIPFSHVSRRFRVIALHVPRIWSCVHITTHRKMEQYDQMLRLELERSGSLPLTILFQPILGAEGRCIQRCWELLLPRAQWWRRLSLFALNVELLNTLFQEQLLDRGTELPLLEHLDVLAWNSNDVMSLTYSRPLSMARIDAPSLKCFRAYNLDVGLFPAPRFAPTELVIYNLPNAMLPDALADGLRAIASSLKVLVLSRVATIYLDNTTQLRTVTFPNLQYLYLEIFSQSSLTSLVPWFLQGTPCLLRLDLATSSSIDVRDFRHQVTSSVCPSVETVAVHPTFFYEDDQTPREMQYSFLKGFPNLRHIITSFDAYEFAETLLLCSKSDFARDGACLWPSLESLTLLTVTSGPKTLPSTLVDFVTYREDVHCPIKRLILSDSVSGVLDERAATLLQQKVYVGHAPPVRTLCAPLEQRWDFHRNALYFPWWTKFAD